MRQPSRAFLPCTTGPHTIRIVGTSATILMPADTPAAKLDDLLIRASQISFRPERLRVYGRAQAFLAEEIPWLQPEPIPLRTSNLRAPGQLSRCFASESLLNEIAADLGVELVLESRVQFAPSDDE